MRIDLFPSCPNSPTEMLTTLAHVLHTRTLDTLRAGFAYVTVGGASELITALGQSSDWDSIRKEFVIGISQGITEPYALSRLLSLPNSEVGVFLPNRLLSKAALYDTPTFHGKILACCLGKTATPIVVIASSANLTTSAVGPKPRNYEFGVGVVSDENGESPDGHHLFNPWWQDAWRHSHQIDQRFIEKYAELRKPFLRKNPALLSVPDAPPTISQAAEFWIEVGKGSGIQRHQVEFSESLVEFFGPISRTKRILTLQKGRKKWDDRPLSHKVTTFDVEIWRLGMPTIAKGGYPIQDRIVWFQRTETPLEFTFDVADVDSSKARKWEARTNLLGHMGQTKGMHLRRYGFA